ncbi:MULTISPECIES: hypothetical protein [unclassified Microcoleus]|uniref:hypothetical protein n=1 Tax=unclassified Microcoleus TaxID=2642155 RepID=UPI002FD70464
MLSWGYYLLVAYIVPHNIRKCCIKQELSWGLYDNLDEIKEKVRSFIKKFSTETIASIAGWDYILSAIGTVAWLWRINITRRKFSQQKGYGL